MKLHPSEEHTFYYKLLDNELKGYKDRVAVIVQEYIWDVLSVTDVELKRSCTTGIESWILGHPTIEMSLNTDEWYYSPEHVVGSDIVTSYDELKNTALKYLHGKAINKNKQAAREDFLNTWCYKVDGMSTQRVVNEIKKLSIQSVFISFHIKDWVIYMLLKVTDYKIHDLRLFGLKSLIINKKIDQLGRVDKYFNNKDIGC